MKMLEAQRIIDTEPAESGFMVGFEWAGDGVLHSDHFPDKHAGEKLIETQREAWDLAYAFAVKTRGTAVNIRVITSDFKPLPGYQYQTIKNR